MKPYEIFPIAFCLVTPLVAQSPTEGSPELEATFQVLCGDQPIDVGRGHAAPYVADIDGDDLQDLLVGEFGKRGFECEGALRIYKNVGSEGKPKFENFEYFQAGGTTGKIPSG